MPNPELQKYVETSLQSNLDVTNVRHALVAAGWDAAEVDEAIATYLHPATETNTPPKMSPGATAIPVVTSAVTTSSNTLSPAATPPTTTPSATNPAENRINRKTSGAKKKILVIGAATMFVLSAVGVAFGLYAGKFGKGSLASDTNLLRKLPENLQAINSATYDIALSFENKAREAGAIPFEFESGAETVPLGTESTLFVFQDYYQFLADLPKDLAVYITLGGSTINKSTSSTDATFHFGGDIRSSDLNANLEADFIKKDADLYFRIGKFPDLFLDLSTIKSKWIAIRPEDMTGTPTGFIDPKTIQELSIELQENNNNKLEQLRLAYTMAYQEGAIILVAPGTSEEISGIETRHLRLGLDRIKMAELYTAVSKELVSRYGSGAIISYDPETEAYLKSPGFKKFFDYLQGNAGFDLWLDAASGQIVKFSYALRIVPPESIDPAGSGESIFRITLGIKDINLPVNVAAPTGAIRFSEAAFLLSGKTPEEYAADTKAATESNENSARLSDINSLNLAIGLYLADVENPIICPDRNKVYSSDRGTDAVNGSGWLPINFAKISGGAPFAKLPRDSKNKDGYVYSYKCAPGTGTTGAAAGATATYELNLKFAGLNEFSNAAIDDGGDNPNVYEKGTNLKLIH